MCPQAIVRVQEKKWTYSSAAFRFLLALSLLLTYWPKLVTC